MLRNLIFRNAQIWLGGSLTDVARRADEHVISLLEIVFRSGDGASTLSEQHHACQLLSSTEFNHQRV